MDYKKIDESIEKSNAEYERFHGLVKQAKRIGDFVYFYMIDRGVKQEFQIWGDKEPIYLTPFYKIGCDFKEFENLDQFVDAFGDIMPQPLPYRLNKTK